MKPERRGEMVSLATDTDRTIYFDFLPLHIDRVRGMSVRFQLFTVPGQVYYSATRKLVLNGADGVVFVADSQRMCRDANMESLKDLRENLKALGIDFDAFPVVFQYNKRDLDNVLSQEELSAQLNPGGRPEFLTSAMSGDGVLDSLKEISRRVVASLSAGKPEAPPQSQEPLASQDTAPEDIDETLDANAGIKGRVVRVTRSGDSDVRPRPTAPDGENVHARPTDVPPPMHARASTSTRPPGASG